MDFTTIMEELIKFRDDRDFKQFHTTKNLTMSICIEATKLLETFQWRNDERIDQIVENDKANIEDKLANILIYAMYLCHNLGINDTSIEAAIYSRIIKESTNMHLTCHREIPLNKPDSNIIELGNKE